LQGRPGPTCGLLALATVVFRCDVAVFACPVLLSLALTSRGRAVLPIVKAGLLASLCSIGPGKSGREAEEDTPCLIPQRERPVLVWETGRSLRAVA
jgi:hypothetical protein